MNLSESSCFFEVSSGPRLDNNLRARYLCMKDFFKKCLMFPAALALKVCKTVLRAVGVCWGGVLIVLTVGSSSKARAFFVGRVASFAKDIADWILLPFALAGCFFRLILAFLIHPNFYFNALA